jgi:cell division protein FtsQ
MPTEPAEDGSRRWRLVRAGKDAVPDSLRRLMSRARPSQLAAVPWTLIVATLAVIGLAGWIIFVSPLFGIKQVQITGVGLLTEAEVLQAAAVPLGQPLTRVDTGSIGERVAKLPAAESVEVIRSWPSTLHIKVIERVGVAVVKQDTVFGVFDRFGVQFISAPAPPVGTVEVILPQNMPADRAMRDALKVIASLTAQLRDQLIRLVVNGPAGIQLLLEKDRMVTWGDAEESDLKAKVATALLTQKGKRIDVSVPEIVTIQ